ncbi:MAG: M14 family metallopeptidase [Acidobacteriota bacterium]
MARRVILTALAAAAAAVTADGQVPAAWQTAAERTDYAATTSYDEVLRIVEGLVEAHGHTRWERFGTSEEGRPLPLLMLSDPAVSTPEQAHKLGRPVVFVMANIHAGEVEGKEAALILARRLAAGDLRSLLKRVVVLIAPIYNADGNEKVSVDNRTAQNGPVGGVGTRENAKGLDLNRDYVKLESAEARALVSLLSRWDPHVVVDLHTTNGSYHGYHLTYAPSLNPNADARLIAYTRERLLPAVQQAVQKKHGLRTYFYGNFASESGIARESPRVDPANPGDAVWRTFDHRPRFGNNYIGLRNRIAVLSEAYSYYDFPGRVRVTEVFVEEVLRAVAGDALGVTQLTARVDRETAAARSLSLGTDFRLAALPEPVEILVGDVAERVNPRSGKPMREMTEQAVPVRMKDYGVFEATATRPLPRGWLLPKAYVESGRLAAALERLRQHGVRLQEVVAEGQIDVERSVVVEYTRAERVFQGHREARLRARYEPAQLSVQAGAWYVPASQPLARLAFYLLEAESDDGFVTWNVISGDGLAPGEAFPVYRVTNLRALKVK